MSTCERSQNLFPPSCALNRDPLKTHSDVNIQNESSPSENEAQFITYVPGDPAVNLLPNEVHNHLSNELDTPLLDELYDKLWLVAKKSGHNVETLHTQKVKGRSIVPTEDPRLHLVWKHNKIFIKPVPEFLFSHEFWTMFLQPPKREPSSNSNQKPSKPLNIVFDRSVAVGFLRSYSFLVRYRLDFAIAKECYLIPATVNWLEWSKFINNFRHIGNESVAKRYHYGQLRLSRLNWAVRIFRPSHARTKWFYEVPFWSLSEFVTRGTIPLIFLFASVSLTLSSMQVALSTPADRLWFQALDENALRVMDRAFWLFSITVIFLWLVIWVFLLGIPLIILCSQFFWAYRNRGKKQSARNSAA